MPLRDRLTRKVARAFDKVWTRLEGPGQSVELLKQSATLNEFESVLIVTSSWFFEYSEFRQAFRLQIAEDDSIESSIAEATHVDVDGDIYVIRNGDTLPPKGTDVTWKLLCERFTKREQFKSLY